MLTNLNTQTNTHESMAFDSSVCGVYPLECDFKVVKRSLICRVCLFISREGDASELDCYLFLTLSVCLQEIQRLQKEADEANKRASLLERESQRLEIQVKDLSQQVEQTLLWFNVLFAIY